uniref:Uncharacterized protein n=1 Tax=Eutreptiella gymnastica TaxID=73025 RepID=A0A7S1ILT0_9EUGL
MVMLAQVERPGRVLVTPEEAGAMGFSLSLMGLTLFNIATTAMKKALAGMAAGVHPPEDDLLPFENLYREVGFNKHYDWEAQMSAADQPIVPSSPHHKPSHRDW